MSASRLPMRNWNSVSISSFIYFGIASRLPMRNWNYVQILLLALYFPLPDYLWGIETIVHQYICTLITKLPDYLWGIETTRPFIDICSSWCFQTTYEELKLLLNVSAIMRTHSLPDYLWGIETQGLCQRQGRKLVASRLPMRNWNCPPR